MSNYIGIAGNPRTGIVVLGDDGALRSLTQAEPPSLWLDSPRAPGFVPGDAAYACLLADGTALATVAHGTAIHFLTTLGNAQARWKNAVPLPAGTGMAGLAGDPQDGYLLLDTDGHGLYRLDGGADGRGGWNAWTRCAAPCLGGKVTLIAGDWRHGMLAVGDGALAKLAPGGADAGWTALPAPPMAIEMVTGNFQDGYIAYGEGQLYMLHMLGAGAQLQWSALPTPDFDLRAMSGDPVHGLAAVLGDSSGDGTLVAYTLHPEKGPWSLALAPQARRP